MKKTDPELKNTLIVVTADHDHTLVLNGYAKRTGKTTANNPGVLGLVKNYETGEPSKDADGMPYTIIGFGNGYNRVDGPRSSVAPLDDATVSANDYHQEVVVKVGEIGNETHGGTDVFLGAIGQERIASTAHSTTPPCSARSRLLLGCKEHSHEKSHQPIHEAEPA